MKAAIQTLMIATVFSIVAGGAQAHPGPAGHRHYKAPPRVLQHRPSLPVPAHRSRHHRGVIIVRPYGHWYRGYGHFHSDDRAWPWLAFTAITLKVLDNLDEQQQREHEAAQIEATSAAVGESIHWNQGNASGSVTAVREGTSSAGRYCREFRQQVTIGGKTEQAWGTACRQPDGSWELISSGQ